MLDRRKSQTSSISTSVAAVIIAVLSLSHHWHFAGTAEEQQQQNKTALNRIPPSIYKWIEENAHICTIVPANGESLINFLSEDEGAKCALCPELGPREVPSMACAIEVSPNEIDVGIGCHPVPELCVLELKTLYAEFFTGALSVGMPPGQPGPPGNEQRIHQSVEEDIFKATGNLFTSVDGRNSVMEVTTEKTEERLEKEEEEEQKEDEQEGKKEKNNMLGGENPKQTQTTTPSSTTTTTTRSSTTTTASTITTPSTTSTTTTTVRANVFARPSPQGVPINLTMEELHLLSRTSKPQKGWRSSLTPPQRKGGNTMGKESEQEEMPMEVKSPANTEPMLMKKRAKGRTGNEVEEEQELDEMLKETVGPCKDRHELCCFWAMSGECDSNPFWMRTKCPMTCGTCGCKVRNADKCRSVGVKCVSTTTTTTPATTTTTTTTSTSTTPTVPMETPTPPPATAPSSSRRRPRPTAPNSQMPGHRPQRPRQRSRTSTTAATSSSTMETTTTAEVDREESSISVGESDGDDVNYYDYDNNDVTSSFVGANSVNKIVSGNSGKRVPEERIDAESRGPIAHQKGMLNLTGPAGYEERTENDEDGSMEPPPMHLSTSLPTSTVSSSTITKEICFNYHKLCDFWAKMGECLNNPFWMRPHCQLSCNSCGESLGDISTPPARSGCNNEHILCPFWGFIGECARNPRWMSTNCRASCELC